MDSKNNENTGELNLMAETEECIGSHSQRTDKDICCSHKVTQLLPNQF